MKPKPQPGTLRLVLSFFVALLMAASVLPIVYGQTPQTSSQQTQSRRGNRREGNVTPRTARVVVSSTPVARAQRVFWCGHSFHMFLAGGREGSEGPVAALAKEAGFSTHSTAGRHMIGGSTPMQHWNQGTEETNTVKVALRSGQVDVLTLASNAVIPEQGIDNFADLAFKHNPDVRVLLQMSWGTYDGLGSTMKPEWRDLMTAEDLAGMREALELHKDRMRQQLRSINDRHGKTFAFLVPSAIAVLKLREEVLHGRVPGVTKQTDLYRDGLGHAKQPIADLNAYLFFAAIYRKSPIGLTALDTQKTSTSKAQHRVLQQIAWETILGEPYSGVRLPMKKIEEKVAGDK